MVDSDWLPEAGGNWWKQQVCGAGQNNNRTTTFQETATLIESLDKPTKT